MPAKRGSARGYARTARVNEVLRQVLADQLERMEELDERFGMLTITAVLCEPGLRHATVLFSSLDDEKRAALEEVRVRLQAAIGHEVRMKHTPLLKFEADPVVAAGQRVEDILRRLAPPGPAQPTTQTDGLVVVDKPAGMTSHDVVGRCRRIFGQKRVGHAGTLDPDATGVLLVGLGRATRLMQYLAGLTKSYTTDIILGTSTSTLDASGEVTATFDMGAVTIAEARDMASKLTGDIEQIPPMVSAVKIGGRRLHQLAREGVEVERPPRPVTVTRFDLDDLGGGRLRATIDCSSGTYVRVLADDLGRLLGGGAHVDNLRRTAVGPFTEAGATPLENVGPDSVRSPSAMVPWLEAATVSGDLEVMVRHGRPLSPAELGAQGAGPLRVLDQAGNLLAIYETDRRVVLAQVVDPH
jgi:tRNA pseudouridine55 synthase